MAELRLTGPTEDGHALRLADPDGAEHTLALTPFLRRLALEDAAPGSTHVDGGAPPSPDPATPAGPGVAAPSGPAPAEPEAVASEAVAPEDAPAEQRASGRPVAPADPSPSPAIRPGEDEDDDERTAPVAPVAEQADVRAAATAEAPPLSPREIQARIRAGASVEQVARESGNAYARIRTYGFPVLAERGYVAQQAQAVQVWVGGPDLYSSTVADGGPTTLGELAAHRLRELGADAGTLAWDAWREPSGTWTVTADFELSAGTGRPTDERPPARWSFRPVGAHLEPRNAWARVLSDAEAWDVFTPDTRAATPLRPDTAEPDPADDPAASAEVEDGGVTPLGTHSRPDAPDADLLEILRARRGQRVGDDVDSDDALAHAIARGVAAREEADGGAAEDLPADEPTAAVPGRAARLLRGLPTPPADEDPAVEDEGASAAERPEPDPVPSATAGPDEDVLRPEATEQAGADPEGPDEAQAARRERPAMPTPRPRARSAARRASVPSWDDIVFGRKGD